MLNGDRSRRGAGPCVEHRLSFAPMKEDREEHEARRRAAAAGGAGGP